MPTTSYVDFDHAVFGISNRTDSAGVAVPDFTAEEARMHLPGFSEGAVDGDAFLVAVGAGMGLTVGSGSAKADRYIVAGEVAGQQTYTVRLDAAPVAVTVPAADASLARTDEVYLVVRDAAYDAGTLSLPQLGYRKGDAGGAAPGPDAGWKASALLASVAVPAAASSITDVTDARSFAYAPSPVPAGTLMPFAGPAAPAGWLLCQGQTVSRSTYRRLFRAIGTAFGVGDGSTTFVLPDTRNRVLVGAGSSYALGETGGAATVTLTEPQMPAHTHDSGSLSAMSAGAHIHDVASRSVGAAQSGAGQAVTTGSDAGTIPTSTAGAHAHSLAGATASVGGSDAVSVMQPYLSAHTIIKV